MTNKGKEMREELRFEIKARKLVLKRLHSPLERALAAAEKQHKARADRMAAASKYRDEDDVQDAYGWGFITEDEMYDIIEAMRDGQEYVDKTRSPEEAAADILKRFVSGLNAEIASFEFDLLPDAEKEKVRRKNEEILARRKARDYGTD